MKWLYAVVLFSLMTKLIILLNMPLREPPLYVSNDTRSYVESARALVYTGTFSISPQDTEPQTIRTPAYPAFLALIYGLFGENDLVVLIVQVVISIGTLIVVYWIGSRLWNFNVGLISCLFLALDFNSAGFSLYLLTETLFTFFLTIFLAAVVAITRLNPQIGDEGKRIAVFAFSAGLFLALATHTRPITYYLIAPVLIVWAIWWNLKKYPLQLFVTPLLAFILPWFVLIGGWQVRNYTLTGSAQFCTIESVSLVNYRAAGILAERDGISRDEAIQEIHTRFNLDQEDGWNEVWRDAGIQVIKENPSIFVSQAMRGLVSIFVGPGSETIARFSGVDIQSTSPLGDLLRLSWDDYVQRWVIASPFYFGTFIFSVLHMLLLYAGVGIWAFQTWGKRNWVFAQQIIFSVILYLAFVSAGPEAYYRFRVPMTPMLVLLAGSAAANIFVKKQSAS